MKKRFLIIILAALFLGSCNDDEFLSKTPHQNSEVTAYTSQEGAIQGLYATYDILQLGEQIGRTELSGTVCSGDAMVGGEPGGNDQPPLQEIAKFLTSANSSYSVAYWRALYRGIYRANLLIKYMAEPSENIDESVRIPILGEAYFLRALFHFKLQVYFGGCPQMNTWPEFNGKLKGVPYVDHLLTPDEWSYMDRPAIEITWTGIENDFKAAADLLLTDAPQLGRATQGAAQAMLAKTYLYQEKWQLALDEAEKVINTGNYYLVGDNEHLQKYMVTRTSTKGDIQVEMPAYKYIFQPEANNSPEEVFSIQHFPESTNRWPEGMEGNLMVQYYGVRSVIAFNPAKDKLEATNFMWGFILPTDYFVKTAYKEVGCEPIAGTILDPRFENTVIEPTDSLPFYYPDADVRAAQSDSVAFNAYFNWPCTGYSTWKYYLDPYYQSGSRLGQYGNNWKVMRFSDLLLIAAEAAFHQGQTAKATDWVNKVRQRARNSGTTGYPQDYATIDLDKIYAERRVELAFEGSQYWDLVRTHRVEKVLKVDAMQWPEITNPLTGDKAPQQYGDNFLSGQNEIMPIAESELDLIKNPGFTQNPGY